MEVKGINIKVGGKIWEELEGGTEDVYMIKCIVYNSKRVNIIVFKCIDMIFPKNC